MLEQQQDHSSLRDTACVSSWVIALSFCREKLRCRERAALVRHESHFRKRTASRSRFQTARRQGRQPLRAAGSSVRRACLCSSRRARPSTTTLLRASRRYPARCRPARDTWGSADYSSTATSGTSRNGVMSLTLPELPHELSQLQRFFLVAVLSRSTNLQAIAEFAFGK